MALKESPELAAIHKLVLAYQLAEAEQALHELIQSNPADPAPAVMLASLLLRSNRAQEADAALSRIEFPVMESCALHGVVKQMQGDFAGAAARFKQAIELGGSTPDLYNQLGACHLALDDPVAAGAAFKRAVELDRTQAHSFYNLGVALSKAGNSYETFATFTRAIDLKPDFFEAYVQLWQQMRRLLLWTDGLPLLEQGLRMFPKSAYMMTMLGMTVGKLGQKDRAAQLFEAAVKLDPSSGPPYAHWLQEEGYFEASIPILETALKDKPLQGQGYYNLAIAKCFQFEGKPLTEITQALRSHSEISRDEQMFLEYASAKTYESQKDYAKAMHHYDEANRIAYELFNAKVKPDLDATESEFQALSTLYSEDTVRRLSKFGSESETPIFIVGMIRTGTTLLDQILNSHPAISSAGEQPFWLVQAGRINRKWLASRPNAADLQDLAQGYLKALELSAGKSRRITDKMPINFIHLGLITSTFPKAKIIHTRRNPVDTCLSIYTTFLGSGTQFAYNQENIVDYYRYYLRAMEHWRAVIPSDRMIEINYENLVTQKESVLPQLLEFLELEWDESVLNHERNTSSVSTPSLWTARQPVNSASVERWRKYEPWLGRLLDLKDVRHPEPVHGIKL